MDKKKGFTLIELLAIIVILAIIAVITVPIILGIIDDSSKGAAVNSAYGFRDAVQNYYAYKSLQDSQSELPNGIVMALNLPSDFSASGELPSDGWVNLTNGNVTEFSLKFGEYVVTKLGDEDVVSEKNDYVVYNIPEEYQRVEYLQSNGSQYIDTGIYLLDGEKASINFSINAYKNYQIIFGQTSTAFGSLQLRQPSGSEGQRYYWYNKNSESLGQLNLNKKSFCSVSLNGDKGEVNLDGRTGVFDVSEDNTNMLIFSRQNTSGYEMNGKVYSFGMGVRRSLVPVVRKSDNKPGMLDMANYSRNLSNINEIRGATWATTNQYFLDMLNNLDTGTYVISYTITLTERNNINDVSYYGIYFNNSSGTTISNQGMSWLNLDVGSSFDVQYSFTINESMKGNFTNAYFYGCGKHGIGPTGKADFINIQIENGTRATPYEPYRGKSFYTNEGTGEFTAGPEL